MAITGGTKLGSYEVLSLLGKGGMGEVWKARDTKLGREVAIKTLPEEFARDVDRLARLERSRHLLMILRLLRKLRRCPQMKEVSNVSFPVFRRWENLCCCKD